MPKQTKHKPTGKPFYVDTPNGRKFHGELRGGTFVRNIDSRYVRWSDHAFTFNTGIANQLLDHCYTLRFQYRMASEMAIYEIGFMEALRMEEVTNEHGEKNIRIPIDKCRLIKRFPLTD